MAIGTIIQRFNTLIRTHMCVSYVLLMENIGLFLVTTYINMDVHIVRERVKSDWSMASALTTYFTLAEHHLI